MLSSQLISEIFFCLLILFCLFHKQMVDRLCHIPKQKRGQKTKQIQNKNKKTQIYTFIHEDFFSLTRTLEDEEHGTTSTLQVVLFF